MGRPPHDLAGGAAIQPWPSSRRSRTRPPRADRAALPARARGAGPGALRAGAGYLAGQLARAARGEHIAFAVGARPIARKGRLPDAAAGDGGASRQARTPPGPPCRITGQADARRMRRCCSAGPGWPC